MSKSPKGKGKKGKSKGTKGSKSKVKSEKSGAVSPAATGHAEPSAAMSGGTFLSFSSATYLGANFDDFFH